MQKKYLVIIVVGVILLIVGITAYTNTKTTNLSKGKAIEVKNSLSSPKITTVKLTDKGFEPQTVNIKIGEAITWSNESGKDASVNSANHPTHKLYPILNLGLFSDGSNIQAQFLTKGTFKYHNHLAPSQTGTVIVE